jgi:hypothetical protein
MRGLGKQRAAVLALVALVVLAGAGWVAARQIRSPAQIAADTAPPAASPITASVERRGLATEVIVRGTVRYGAAQSVVLATSRIKQGSDIVTRPPRKQATLRPGRVAMAVDGRPVFVLPGDVPMHRDLNRGDRGGDVRQLELALAQLGHRPGRVDGLYDAATERAVSSFYLSRGWDPFGPTDLQLEQLRTAAAAAAQARDANLQAVNAVEIARRPSRPADVAQARRDVVTARDAIATAQLGVARAAAKLGTAQAVAGNAPELLELAQANARRDLAAADTDVAAKRSAVTAAAEEARLAGLRRYEVPLDAPPAERESAAVAEAQAQEAVTRARADLEAAIASADAVRAAGRSDLRKARSDRGKLVRDVRVADAELDRARTSVGVARRQAALVERRSRLLTLPAGGTRTLQRIADSTLREARRTQAEVDRLTAEAGVQVPANELLFFRSLPLRVDTVSARRGNSVSGTVMKVTSSQLTVDSSLTVSDAKLVRPGDRVLIEEQDLGVRARGRVGTVSRTPGTNRVDPSRFYFSVIPDVGVPSLVGASVKLTIEVRSSEGAVLAVPVSALSVGGDGDSRLQVRRGGRTQIVTVVPGLAAEGLVEVRPAAGQRLDPGDLVIVGTQRGGAPATAPAATRTP